MFQKSNKSLILLISFCIHNGFPELLYNLMDCFTKDRIECISTTPNDISITDWINCNNFFETIKHHSNKWYQRWKCGFRVYINRIIPKMDLQFVSPQIDDSIEEIMDYLLLTPIFVLRSDDYTLNYPFQLDIAITVKNVKYIKQLMDIDDSDDDDESDDVKDIYNDKVNKQKFWWIDDKYTKHVINCKYNSPWFPIGSGHNIKYFVNKYQQTLMQMFGYKVCDKPYYQRICMLIDRRDTKLELSKIKEIHEMIVYGYIRSIESDYHYIRIPYDIYNLCVVMMDDSNNYPNILQYDPNNVNATIFIPPIYNQIPHNSVNEFYHYSSQKCVIPTNVGYITSLNSTQYNVLLFSLHAKEEDCVQCYIHWNGKTIRAFPKDMLRILRKLFYSKNKINQDYLNKLNSTLLDEKFNAIYNSIHLFT